MCIYTKKAVLDYIQKRPKLTRLLHTRKTIQSKAQIGGIITLIWHYKILCTKPIVTITKTPLRIASTARVILAKNLEGNIMGNTEENTTIASELETAAISDQQHVWHHLMQHKGFEQTAPKIMVSGEGLRITDDKGNTYLDAVSGAVWTVNVGYGRERIAKAVYEQIKKMNFFAGSAGNVPGAQYAKMLTDVMPGLDRVYYSNSGSEANEKAFKIVRQISHNKYGGKKHKILFRERDYHGTTITALSATGQNQRKDQYGPFTPGFVEFPHCCEYRSQFGDVADYGVQAALEMEKVILAEGPDTFGAVILEPITAGGGVITPPEGYYETIQALCKKYELLLIIDEVVCGLGRTGTWFGYQHYGVQPDIVTMAKGVASGYAAISCTVTTEAVFNEL